MDFQDNSVARSPRKEIQGPRPTPLRVRKDSHKIRKPPAAPPAAAAAHPPAPPRPPVIIYTVSPKVIHANPNEFMSLVQRLTGPNSSSCASYSNYSSSAAPPPFAFQENGGAVSPAARLASIERIKSPEGRRIPRIMEYDDQMGTIEIGSELIQRTAQFPGILSPNPTALPPIPPNFFSPPSDPVNSLGFFPEFSPINLQHSNSRNIAYKNYAEMSNGFISPSTLFSPQIGVPSPQTLHLFNTLFDL